MKIRSQYIKPEKVQEFMHQVESQDGQIVCVTPSDYGISVFGISQIERYMVIFRVKED